MSEDAPGERSYGAGEDIPGTPGPFPYDLVTFACAAGSAAFASATMFGLGLPIVLTLAPTVAWMLFGLAGLTQGAWKGFLLGLPVIVAPWIVMFVLIVKMFAPE